MKADDALLTAYVDGELAPPERSEIERHIRNTPELANRVEQLLATRWATREAFAHQKLPPVPDSLFRSVAGLADAARADAARTADRRGMPRRSSRTAMVRPALAWLAGAFAAGAVCAGLVAQVWPGLGLLSGGSTGQHGAIAMASTPWVREAVNYIALYTRDTLEYGEASPEVVAKTVADIEREDGMSLRIPDLTQAGLTFKAIQRLSFNGKSLVQIMYLPKQGDPVALCVIKDTQPDQAVADQRVARKQVVTWRQSELGYALIGAPNQSDLPNIAHDIADKRVQPLTLERT